MGRAAALLGGRRAAAFAAISAALGLYYLVAPHLWDASVNWDVVWIAAVLLPVVFALVWLALPLARAREAELLLAAAACAVAALAFGWAGFVFPASLAKLVAAAFAAFWFLNLFETAWWVALVAVIIPWVDVYSVFWGPTKKIVEDHPHGLSAFSFNFRTPGARDYASLGLPDLLFFALFLAATVRWRLRPRATWLAMVALLGLTFLLAVWLDLNGLPALPAVSIGFLLANADLLWRRRRLDG